MQSQRLLGHIKRARDKLLGNHLLGIYEKAFPSEMDWKTRLNSAKTLGFDYLEISIDETDTRLARLDWTKVEKQKLLALSQEIELPIRSMCLSAHRKYPFGSADSSVREKAYEIMQRAIDFADYLGIRVIQLAGYDVYYETSTEDSRQAFLEGLIWSCNAAERSMVMLAMEIMDTSFLNSITKHLWYERQIESPWYGLYPDLGNLSAWDNNVTSELAAGIHSIVAVHLKDTIKVTDDFPGKFKGVPFGTGCVDFVKAFQTLGQLDYQGPFLIEMWADAGNNPMEQVKEAKAFIQHAWDTAQAGRSD